MSNFKCTKCKIDKDILEFHKDSSKNDGHCSQCKDCKYMYRQTNIYKINLKSYQESESGTLSRKNAVNKYEKSENGIKVTNNYRNSEEYKASQHISQQKHILTDKFRNTRSLYLSSDNYKSLNNAKVAKYKASKLQACPKWADLEKIKEVYQDAADCQWLSEEPLEVDHIIPLQGKDVSGLHVHWNLQIITRSENRKKSNKHE